MTRGILTADAYGYTLETKSHRVGIFVKVARRVRGSAPRGPNGGYVVSTAPRDFDWINEDQGFMFGDRPICILQIIEPSDGIRDAKHPDILGWLKVHDEYCAEVMNVERRLREMYRDPSLSHDEACNHEAQVVPGLYKDIDRRYKSHLGWIRQFAMDARPSRLPRLQSIYYGITNSSNIITSDDKIAATTDALKRAFSGIAGWQN